MRGHILLPLFLAACGSERSDEGNAGGATAGAEVSAQQVRACEVLDLETARRAIGPETEHPGEDTEPLTCQYVNPGVAMLTAQLSPAAWYDQVTIAKPHTPVQVGERARMNAQETGVVAVQFVKGSHSATLSVQPIGKSEADYQSLLTTAASEMAARLP